MPLRQSPTPSLSGPWSKSQEARKGRLHPPAIIEALPHQGRANFQALGSLSRRRVAWGVQAAITGGRNRSWGRTEPAPPTTHRKLLASD